MHPRIYPEAEIVKCLVFFKTKQKMSKIFDIKWHVPDHSNSNLFVTVT